MSDRERGVAETRFLEDVFRLWLEKLLIELLQKRGITPGGQSRFFIKERKNTESTFDHVDTRLIVREVDEGPVDLLTDVFFLLQLENMGVKLEYRY